MDTLLATFGNVHDAPILLPAIIQSNLIVNRSILLSSILSKYKDDVLGQFHKFIGSADFLGNPIGLFTTVFSGVNDVFFEPIEGIVKNDPKQLGIGLVKVGFEVSNLIQDNDTDDDREERVCFPKLSMVFQMHFQSSLEVLARVSLS